MHSVSIDIIQLIFEHLPPAELEDLHGACRGFRSALFDIHQCYASHTIDVDAAHNVTFIRLPSQWSVLVFLIFIIATLGALFRAHRHRVLGFVLLGIFTLFCSGVFYIVVSLYEPRLVHPALAYTLTILITLIAVVVKTRFDFSRLDPYLDIASWILAIVRIFAFFHLNRVFDPFFFVTGVTLSCGNIIFDIYNIINVQSHDEYNIVASIEVYLDAVILFFNILMILVSLDN